MRQTRLECRRAVGKLFAGGKRSIVVVPTSGPSIECSIYCFVDSDIPLIYYYG